MQLIFCCKHFQCILHTVLTGTKTLAFGLSTNSFALGLRLDFFKVSDTLSTDSPAFSSTGVASRGAPPLGPGGVTRLGVVLTCTGLTTGERDGCAGTG